MYTYVYVFLPALLQRAEDLRGRPGEVREIRAARAESVQAQHNLY